MLSIPALLALGSEEGRVSQSSLYREEVKQHMPSPMAEAYSLGLCHHEPLSSCQCQLYIPRPFKLPPSKSTSTPSTIPTPNHQRPFEHIFEVTYLLLTPELQDRKDL